MIRWPSDSPLIFLLSDSISSIPHRVPHRKVAVACSEGRDSSFILASKIPRKPVFSPMYRSSIPILNTQIFALVIIVELCLLHQGDDADRGPTWLRVALILGIVLCVNPRRVICPPPTLQIFDSFSSIPKVTLRETRIVSFPSRDRKEKGRFDPRHCLHSYVYPRLVSSCPNSTL